jgi:hypothetical protein
MDRCGAVSSVFRAYVNSSTYFVAFCCLVQLQMLFDLPTPMGLAEVDLPLPCSEEEWSANEEDWWVRDIAPTPNFHDIFKELFGAMDDSPRYSELGGYILISGVLLAILNGHRQALFPAVTVNFRDFNSALENWKKLWHADPRSERAGPSSPHCPVAFNAWVIYRVACVRTFRDYSRYSLFILIQNQSFDGIL